jgi:vitamin B12 transporter
MFALFCVSQAYAGSIITGTVSDEEGRPVQDVNIIVEGTVYGAVTDSGGRFFIPRLSDGEYRLEFSHICCKTSYSDVVSGTADRIDLDIVLDMKTIELDPVYALVLPENAPHIAVTAREISLSGSKTAQEILMKVPGVNVESVNGSRSRVSVRGTDSKHTSVYLDGVLLNSPMDGSFDLGSIPSEIIEKIEIYKAGENTLSSRSVGGIISITSKKNSGADEIFASYGNSVYLSDRDSFGLEKFNNHEYGCGLRRKFGGVHGVFLSFSGRRNENEWSYINAAKADEYRYINNPNTSRAQTNSYSYSDNIYASYNYASEIFEGSAGAGYSVHKYGIPGWYDQPYYEAFSSKTDLIMSGYAVYNTDDIQYRLDTSISQRKDRTKIEEISPLYYVDSQNRFSNSTLKLQSRYTLEGLVIRAGAEFFSESVASEYLSDSKKERDILSFFARYEHKLELNELFSFNTSVGIRDDLISGSSYDRSLLSSSLSPAFKTDRFSLIGSYSYDQSYNLPSFSDLFWAENLFSSGNPDLKPEYSVQNEVSLSSVLKMDRYRFSSSYTYYDKELEDLIVWIKRVNGKYTPENFKSGIIRGHEISFTADHDEYLSIKADYQIMDTRQFTDNPVTNDKFIIYKPVEILSISLSGNYKDCHAEIRMKYTGRMYLNESNSIDTYPYTLFGADISRKMKLRGTEVTVSICGENLFDEQYQVIYGYPMPGRKLEAKIKIKI